MAFIPARGGTAPGVVGAAPVAGLSPQQQLADFFDRVYTEHCTINGVQFHMDPQSYDETSDPIATEQPTLGNGVVRTNFGRKPAVIQLEGMTGLAGLHQHAGSVGSMEQIEELKRLVGTNELVTFTYPNMFKHHKYCYLQRFNRFTRQDAHLYYCYTIELREYPKSAPAPAIKISSAIGIAIGLPVDQPTRTITPAETVTRSGAAAANASTSTGGAAILRIG